MALPRTGRGDRYHRRVLVRDAAFVGDVSDPPIGRWRRLGRAVVIACLAADRCTSGLALLSGSIDYQVRSTPVPANSLVLSRAIDLAHFNGAPDTLIVFDTRLSVETVDRFYRQNLSRKGWTNSLRYGRGGLLANSPTESSGATAAVGFESICEATHD
ncbi:MAG: hypothetical protein M3552_21850 [Planctomycetota bacterium]|nr:hypothetical protein [Planctomycetaceae bacterium]MDQ3333256.1 hypothetical protein [Planctomycetota bacterium]